ncbi:unnamed protein product, partial [Urochloa humidicola]
ETDTRPSPLNTLPTAIASRKKRNQGETNPSPSHPLLRRHPDPEGAMPLRSLARKMRAPATAALRRVLSPAAGAALRASHSSQNGGGSRAVSGVKNVRAALKDMEKWNRETVGDYAEAVSFVNTLPRRIVLSASSAIIVFTSGLAYAFGAFDGNRKYLDP